MPPDWNGAYTGTTPPAWENAGPQLPFAALAHDGRLRGRVLDAGCGTGVHALAAAENPASSHVLGLDLSDYAIRLATARSHDRFLIHKCAFKVGSVLALPPGATFDTVIDVGTFHSLSPGDRAQYTAALTASTAPGSILYLMCFSDSEPGRWGPYRIPAAELHSTFNHRNWHIQSLVPAALEINPSSEAAAHGHRSAQTHLMTAVRI